MKLFYDARYIRLDFHDGISRYSTELAKALLALTPITLIISDIGQRDMIDKNVPYILVPAPGIAEPFISLLINKHQPDVVFSPLQTFGALGRKFKLIVTSHDMIYYNYRTPPHNLSPLLRLGWFLYHLSYVPQRSALNRADIVATVSHTTQRDFEKAHLTKRPIVVVPNAPQDLHPFITNVIHTAAPKNIVYMGSFMPYKNVETLIRGMKWLPGRTLHLLSRINDKRRAELEEITPKNAHIMYHNGVSDEEYAKILADDAILVSASLYEGYGLPIAEALALDVPAVVSDIPIFHEVAAGGAAYFAPRDPQAFSQQIQALDDPKVLSQLVAAGKAHIRNFTWEASAQTLLHTIKSLV